MTDETKQALVEENQALRLENTELRIRLLSYERDDLIKRSKPMFVTDLRARVDAATGRRSWTR